jgi:hypothetical protein
MATIRLSEKDLVGRRNEILKLVGPLVADRNRIEIRPVGLGQNIRLGVINKGTIPQAILDVDLIRIPTKVRGVFLNYYELWLSQSNGNYDLDRTYLHLNLKRSSDETERQILCLHCDVTLQVSSTVSPFKLGPHLHVGGANPDISKAHIGICINDANKGGSTVESLTKTLSLAVSMISLEIFPRYS